MGQTNRKKSNGERISMYVYALPETEYEEREREKK